MLSTQKDCLETQSSRSSSLWWNLGKPDSKLRESHDCSLDNRSLTDEVLKTKMCFFCGTDSQRKTPDSSKWRSWRPNSTYSTSTNHFLLGRENASAPFMQSSERYQNLRKSFKTAQAYADMIWKGGNREYLAQWNQRLKWSREHVRKLKDGELVWLEDDSVWNAVCINRDKSVRSSLTTTVLWDQRESKWHMDS